MEQDNGYEPGATIRILDRIVRLLLTGLLILLVVLVPIAALAVAGRGDIALSGTVTEPVTITFEDGRYIGVGEDGVLRVFGNFPIAGRESETVRSGTVVHAAIEVTRDDTDSRLIVVCATAGLLALAWVGLVAMRNIIAAALSGQPFADQNPGRVRRLAVALIAASLVFALMQWLLNRTLDADIGLRVSYGWAVWTPALAGVGVLGLAEFFAEAARLRKFEESTI